MSIVCLICLYSKQSAEVLSLNKYHYLLQVEDSLDRVGPGEREFLIAPDFSSVVMLSLGHIQQSQENKIAQTKKPFDWMTDDQFHNLQVLATHFEWFQV